MSETRSQSSLLAWLTVAALAAGLLFLYAANSRKNAQLAGLHAELQRAQEQRAELEQAKADEAAAHRSEMTRLLEDRSELLRLRNEVRQSRQDAEQLTKQAQAQAAQASFASAQKQRESLQAQNQLARQAQVQAAQRDACISNLRSIDKAKQQWGGVRLASVSFNAGVRTQQELAVAHGKVGEAIPPAQDIAAYFSGAVLPTCPAGGVYTLNAVKAAPTCSIPGHALPP